MARLIPKLVNGRWVIKHKSERLWKATFATKEKADIVVSNIRRDWLRDPDREAIDLKANFVKRLEDTHREEDMVTLRAKRAVAKT